MFDKWLISVLFVAGIVWVAATSCSVIANLGVIEDHETRIEALEAR